MNVQHFNGPYRLVLVLLALCISEYTIVFHDSIYLLYLISLCVVFLVFRSIRSSVRSHYVTTVCLRKTEGRRPSVVRVLAPDKNCWSGRNFQC
jgi:hypothetical protein